MPKIKEQDAWSERLAVLHDEDQGVHRQTEECIAVSEKANYNVDRSSL